MMRLSLRSRLTVVFTMAMALVLAAVGAFLYLRLGSELRQSIDMSLRARAQTISHGIEGGTSAVGSGSGLIDPDEALAQVVDPSGNVLDATTGVTGGSLVAPEQLASIPPPLFLDQAIPSLEDEDGYRLLVVPVEAPSGTVFVVVGATLSDRGEALNELLLLLSIGGPVALILASLAGWVLAGALLRPVERIREEAEAISVSEPGRRLPVPHGDDEIARLGATLNSMLDRLQGAFDREHRLVDQASHELRTPLAVLKAELDLALSRERSPGELVESLRSASRETDLLARLADDLLVLARADEGRLPIRRTQVELGELLSSTASRWQPRAEAVGARVVVDAPAAALSLDPVRIRQALDNLVDNALRHGDAPTCITLRGRIDGGEVRLSVEDDGVGFGPEILDRAFEPFARTAAGETGLGLAVVRAVAEAHGGSVEAKNRPTGAVVTMCLRAGLD